MKIKRILRKMLLVILFLSLILPTVPAATSAAAYKVKLNKTNITLRVGYTTTLKLTKGSKKVKAIWTSNKPKIASINKRSGQIGQITAKKQGKCTITATYARKKYKCKVTVKKKSSSTSYPPYNDYPSYTPKPSYDYDYPSYTPKPSYAPSNNDTSQFIDSINMIGFVNSKSDKIKIETSLPLDFSENTWYLLYVAMDTNGNILDAEEYNPEKLFFFVGQPIMLIDSKFSAGKIYTNDKMNITAASILVNPGPNADQGGEVEFRAMSTKTGKVSKKTFTISGSYNSDLESTYTSEPEYSIESTHIPEPAYSIEPTYMPALVDTPEPIYTSKPVDTPESDKDIINDGDSDSIHYLTPYQTNNMEIYDNDSTSSFTMMGIKYYQGIIPKYSDSSKIVLYNLDSKFSTVSFDVGHLDDKNKANPILYVYTDNVLVESIDLTSDMITRKLTINTTNVKQLRIQYDKYGAFYGIGNVIGYGGHIFEEQVTKIANVLQDGVKTYTCKYCDKSYTETIPAQKKCTPHLKPYQATNGKIYDNDGKSYFTVMGKRYYEGVMPEYSESSKEWLYNLKNQFSSVTFSVGHCDNKNRADAIMCVYADGVKVKEIILESDMISQKITINTDGVTQLKFAYERYGAFYAIYDMNFNSSIEIEHSFIEEIDEELGVTRYTCENCGSFYIE